MIESFYRWIAADDAPKCAHLQCDRRTALMFVRGCKWNEDKGRRKYEKYVEVRNRFGDCSLERIAPFLATGVHVMPPGAEDSNGCQMMFVTVKMMDRNRGKFCNVTAEKKLI